MAVVESGALASRGFANLDVFRQIGLLIGLAASIAIGIAVANWSQTPDYRVLYSSLTLEDASEIASALDRLDVSYRVSDSSGTILVPSSELQSTRISLASEGLPKGTGTGYEILEKERGFGVSHFMENIRYQRALEGELSRTISSINTIRSARVHLALPKNTAFIKRKKKATASVTVDMYPGRSVDSEQVGAITHLVAASIPDLEADDVTVVDQKGRLLSQDSRDDDISMTAAQLNYRKNLENYYISRIENILSPIMGGGSIRAQVSADIDFTRTEQTQETFNPELPAIRNEQLISEQSKGVASGGVPGSLSNQPQDVQANISLSDSSQPGQSMSRTVRNYELDKTISHIRFAGNALKRLSVAVVVDNERVMNADGEVESRAIEQEKLEEITDLVRKAVGFDVTRGDTINVINSRFFEPLEVAEEEDQSLLDNPNVTTLTKYVGAGVIILLLIFGLLKPIMKELIKMPPKITKTVINQGDGTVSGDGNVMSHQPTPAEMLETGLTNAKKVAADDPKRVAQVVNNWVSTDG